MSRIMNDKIILTTEESTVLRHQLMHPDPEMMERRNNFFKRIEDTITMTWIPNGGWEVTVKDLDFKILGDFCLIDHTYIPAKNITPHYVESTVSITYQ